MHIPSSLLAYTFPFHHSSSIQLVHSSLLPSLTRLVFVDLLTSHYLDTATFSSPVQCEVRSRYGFSCYISSLPTEILLKVFESCDNVAEPLRLARTCKPIYSPYEQHRPFIEWKVIVSYY